MEIRLLNGHELQWAVDTANEVFETCIRYQVRSQEEIDQYHRYVRADYLWQEMSAGRLFLWGVFENGQMCAVSAMQNVGHITMLYVKPGFWRRRIGMQLLNQMMQWAAFSLRLDRVTVNVTPAASAPFFYRMGFVMMQGMGADRPYVSLEYRFALQQEQAYPQQRAKKPGVTYPVKKVKGRTILVTALATLLLCFGIVGGVTVHHMVTDGIVAEEGWD